MGIDCPSFKTICYWVNELRRGRQDLKDKPHSGRPADAMTEEIVQKVAEVVKQNRHISTHFLAKTLGISHMTIHRILRSNLGFKKIQCKWVPKLLSNFEMQKRVESCQSLLAMFRTNRDNVINHIITQDETLIYYYTPMSKHQSKVWLGGGDAVPKLPRSAAPNGKVMLSVWWDC